MFFLGTQRFVVQSAFTEPRCHPHLRLQHNRSLKAFAFYYVELQIYRETPLVQRDIKGSKNCLPLECSRRPKRHRLTLSWSCPPTSTVEARGHKGEMRRRNDRLGEDVTSLDQPPPPLGETHQEGHLKVTLEVFLTSPRTTAAEGQAGQHAS